jgi:hypothetical protein
MRDAEGDGPAACWCILSREKGDSGACCTYVPSCFKFLAIGRDFTTTPSKRPVLRIPNDIVESLLKG